jgi:hypothetical protein
MPEALHRRKGPSTLQLNEFRMANGRQMRAASLSRETATYQLRHINFELERPWHYQCVHPPLTARAMRPASVIRIRTMPTI